MSRNLRCVTVGAGYFAQFQYDAWNRMPNVSVAAVCNRSVEKANAVAAEFNIPAVYGYDQFGEMLDREQPDFIDVITPPNTHFEVCQQAIERGVSIVCQKPLAPTWDETLQLAKLVSESSVRFMVHENWRWQPWYREIKTLLTDGVIGDPWQIAFRCRMGDGWGDDAYLARQPFFRDYPRLFLFETGVHFLDTFRFLLGEPKSI
ncbi:MAG: Gfo/Idh/MocA family protein, partial [Planctomycetaceae bacterium]